VATTPQQAVNAANQADQSTVQEQTTGDDTSCASTGAKKYPDGSIRTPDGKFAGTTGKPPGTPAVDKAAAEINAKPGWSVQGKEISVRDSEGTLRRYDLVAKNPEGKFVGIEVKGGSAVRTAQQKAIDTALNNAGGFETVGKRAAAAGIDRIDCATLMDKL
jgi:hypothetical protein